ncbi:MAG: chromosomal replication initiator protein DnaA [Limnochordaceae bacterium]|nr:chromosomal replication initiator protein DnaA [Limnochordaceae bacterium]
MQSWSELWNATVSMLREREGMSPGFDTWLRASRPVGLDGETLVVEVPDAFTRDWVRARYGPAMEALLTGLAGHPCSVVLVAPGEPTPSRARPFPSSDPPQRGAPPAPDVAADEDPSHPTGPGGLNPRYTFDTFVVGASNRFAYSACQGVLSNPGGPYNPLFLYGGVGLGKTHLMQAVAHEFLRQRSHLRVLYITTETFTNDLVDSLQRRSMPEFRSRYRSLDVLLLDDVHFAAGKESTQEEFFHTFNALYEAGRQIILSSDRPPVEIPKLEERLRSRFAWGLLADIQPPDFETRLAILRKRCETSGTPVPDEVLHYIAESIQSNIRVLEGALRKVVTAARLSGSPATLDLAAEVLRDLTESQRRPLTIDRIQTVVAQHFGIEPEELRGKSRTRDVAFARQIAMFLARELTQASLPHIGDQFGGRDHSTVLHAIERVQAAMRADGAVNDLIRHLRQRLSRT